MCRTGTDSPGIQFERATGRLLSHKALLPGVSVLERSVPKLRHRIEKRLWRLSGRGNDFNAFPFRWFKNPQSGHWTKPISVDSLTSKH